MVCFFYVIRMKIMIFMKICALLFQKEDDKRTSWDDKSDLCMLKVSSTEELYFLFLLEIFRIAFIFRYFKSSSTSAASSDNLLYLLSPLVLYLLQIYGIKTFVKSYLPVKDAHVRPGIDKLLDILRNILSYGEISADIQSRYIN